MLLSYKFKNLEYEYECLIIEIKRLNKILYYLDPLFPGLKITVIIETDYSRFATGTPLKVVVTDENSWIPMFRPIQRCLHSIYSRRLGEAERRLEDFRKKSIEHTLPDLTKEFIKTL